MSVSVIIPTHNPTSVLQEVLSQLLAQEGVPGRPEIVVVDDGSQGDLARRLTAPLGDAVKLVVLPRNRGRAAARNEGVAASTGEKLVFLDSDVVPRDRTYLASHLRVQQSGPEVVGLGEIHYRREHLARSPFARYRNKRESLAGRAEEFDPADMPYRFCLTGNMSLHRVAYERAGGFDEEFVEHGLEDVVLGYRLADAGCRFQYLPDAGAYHDDPNDSLQLALARMVSMSRVNVPLVQAKYPTAMSGLPGMAALEDPEAPETWADRTRRSLRWGICDRAYGARSISRLFETVLPDPLLFPLYRLMLGGAYLAGKRARGSR